MPSRWRIGAFFTFDRASRREYEGLSFGAADTTLLSSGGDNTADLPLGSPNAFAPDPCCRSRS